MQRQTNTIWHKDEYTYPLSFGFVPNLHSYIHDEDKKQRPGMIIVPGGAYCVVSPTEGEIVAMKFYEAGFQVFVLTYTTNPTKQAPLKLQALKDLSRAVRYIRKNADAFCVQPHKLAICGFSAGGHLSASLCTHFADIADENTEYKSISNRPDAALLSYPVITTGEYAHQGSVEALLGESPSKEEKEYMSLEKQVKEDTPPCFLWHTATDADVPVENSLLFAAACKEKKVPFALHIFSHGPHGLSLANDDWANERYGEPYTVELILRIREKAQKGELPVSEEVWNRFRNMDSEQAKKIPNEEVAVWPMLAIPWLRGVL